MATTGTGTTTVAHLAAQRPSLVDIEDCHTPLDDKTSKTAQGHISPVHKQTSAPSPSRFSVDLPIKPGRVNRLIQHRANAAPIKPDLVAVSEVRDPTAYKRFKDAEKKDAFRHSLLDQLNGEWTRLYGPEKAGKLQEQFAELVTILDENGANIFGALITKAAFEELIVQYNAILKDHGSKSWIHSYINLANHSDFLGEKSFNGAFLHPLLISLISYRIGGPIRIVDARGKDAEPISVLAQDNMLHIDNTPFNDEYKLILTWEKDKPSGPKGQNFAFIPGTHQGARNCFINAQGEAWSTENASIFITEDSIQQIFDFQRTVLGDAAPMVVEAHHEDKPLTTVFAAGSLVHHRYRTKEGLARSCMIIAFHRAADNPGQFITPISLANISVPGDLNSFLFGQHGAGTDDQFLAALTANSADIAAIMDKLHEGTDGAELVSQHKRKLSDTELERWKGTSTHAPTVEELKMDKHLVPLSTELSKEEFTDTLSKMMLFDKHGPLDLILYSDSHEEIRKWSRNQIREMRVDRLNTRLAEWTSDLEQPNPAHLLTARQLRNMANELASIAEEEIALGNSAMLDPHEKISQTDAFRSIRQLSVDLGEAIVRCENRQKFLSTSLFIFWACDTLSRLQSTPNARVRELGNQLLANYIATGILVEKQIQSEQTTPKKAPA